MPWAYQVFGKIESPIDVLTEEYIDKLHDDFYRTKHQSDHSEAVTDTAPQDDGGANSRSRKWHPRTHKRHSADTTAFHMEWHNFGFKPGAFNLELWWYKSRFGSRLNALIVLILIIFALIHGIGGMYFIITHFTSTSDINPYICITKDCHKATKWMIETMDETVDPCENFYEFVCSNDNEFDYNMNFFSEYINGPSYQTEFGENSILAKILKTDNLENENLDQHIKYYQTCLNERTRKKNGIKALVGTIQSLFETMNLTTFEGSTLQLEEVGVRIFRVMGHAVYLNVAFHSFPYIQRWSHNAWIGFFGENFDDKSLRSIFQYFLPEVGIPKGSDVEVDMIKGVETIFNVLRKIHELYLELDGTSSSTFPDRVKTKLAGLCPPMGVKINIKSIFDKFIGDNYRWIYTNPETEAYSQALEICFDEDPSKNSSVMFVFIAGIWIFGLIYDYFPHMAQRIVDDCELNRSSSLVKNMIKDFEFSLESRCFEAMWENLGYIPITAFLQGLAVDPVVYSMEKSEEINELFNETRQNWLKIPDTQIWEPQKFLGRVIFERDLHTDVAMAGMDDLVWDTDSDLLGLKNDHLENSLLAVKYVVERARRTWQGSTDPDPNAKWWGEGVNYNLRIRAMLFNFQQSYIVAAQFQEKKGAARDGKWKRFLGRDQSNYILFPLSAFHEPHTSENLWLEVGGIIFKIIRSFLSIVSNTFEMGKYSNTSWMNIDLILDKGNKGSNYTQENHKCLSFDSFDPFKTRKAPFDYRLTSSTLELFSWEQHQDFMNTIAVKLAMKHFRKKMKALLKLPFGWNLDRETRHILLNRFLPGALSKFSEDQLLFMAIVRQNCRGSWKKFDTYKNERYFLETTVLNMLMQTEEFSEVFKCQPKSFMNLGDNRCLTWRL